MKRTYEVEVTQTRVIHVTLDEDEFSPEFIDEFRESFYPLSTVREHVKHLAFNTPESGNQFIEGYGYVMQNGRYDAHATDLKMNIDLTVMSTNTDVCILSESDVPTK